MSRKQYARTLTLYLTEALNQRLEAVYLTQNRAWKRNAKGAWIHKSRSEFMVELLEKALDNDATLEASRVVLAGRFGERISLRLDGLLLMLRVLIDLLCTAARITDAQKNEAFKRAAADVQFDQRLTDLRQFYQAKTSEKETP